MTQQERLTKEFQELDRVTPRPLDHEDYAIAALRFFKNESIVESGRDMSGPPYSKVDFEDEQNDNPCGTEDELTKLIQRKDELEEWLTEYRDQLKKENAFHKNTGIINAINEILGA